MQQIMQHLYLPVLDMAFLGACGSVLAILFGKSELQGTNTSRGGFSSRPTESLTMPVCELAFSNLILVK